MTREWVSYQDFFIIMEVNSSFNPLAELINI